MPRKPRAESSAGIYHVMLRGINRQKIFHTEADYQLFLKTLAECKEQSNFQLFAYCLMPNHIHLLIGTPPDSDNLETIFKKIGTRFVYWYNRNHQRVGHLFQDRFRSETVETDQYFRVVFRYILQNPYKAGLENALGDYPWSSYSAYFSHPDGITDTEKVISIFESFDWLKEFVHVTNSGDTINVHTFPPMTINDEAALKIILELSNCNSISEFYKIPNIVKDQLNIKFLQHNLSCKQICRITGMSRDKVCKARKKLPGTA